MPSLLLVFAVSILIGCASSKAPPAPECKAGEFTGVGIGESENAALAEAHSALARQINSSIKVTSERTVSQQVSGGKEDLSSEYKSWALVESSLPNAHDARIAGIRQSGGKTSVTVCMSKSDAAKGFAERQRLVTDSLTLASNTTLSTEHPKQKNEAWQRAQMLYNDYMRINYLLESLGAKSNYSAEELYSKARENYRNYCQTSKLHWNPERENLYSEMSFARLSQKVKIEKSPCTGRGISLVCKTQEPKCERAGGLFKCSVQPSLLIASCDGKEYRLLEGGSIGGINQREDVALEKLQATFRDEAFWNEWESEIQQWGPKCE